MSEEDRSLAPRELKWCVGKFVYARGASKPLHFMELKNFIIEDATDYSHLFYLRGLRSRHSGRGPIDEELKRWMEGTAVKPLGEVVSHVLASVNSPHRSIVEYYPGVGLTVEYVKLIFQENQATSEEPLGVIMSYEGRGPANLKNQFLVLQADQDIDVQYSSDLQSALSGTDVVTVINLNQSIRYDADSQFSLESFLESGGGPKVLALRVTSGDESVWHMTVKGRPIKLPALGEVFDVCKQFGSHWNFRFIERFDGGFFLPMSGAPTGLLLAYDARRDWPLKGYSKG
jgi:hypothetical protein